MKQAILVVSFGSTHLDTIENAIVPLELAVQTANPDIPCVRAFSSLMVCKRLKEKQGYQVDTVAEALDKLAQDGFTHIRVIPTLLIPGEEYCKIQSLCRKHCGNMEVTVQPPILHSKAPIDAMAAIVKKAYPTGDDTLLIGMGHGTSHEADDIYDQLAEAMAPAVVCTVEGKRDFSLAVSAAKASGCRKVLLVPLLIVAGDHAKNDMAGNEPGSLKSMLEIEGFEVACALKGLGELSEVQQQFMKRI